MHENQIASVVLDEAIALHKSLGPGLLESVYETILAHKLRKRGLEARQQVPISLEYDGVQLKKCFVADIVINNLVILEIKSQQKNQDLHRMQLLSYLKISKKKLGLVLNFGMGLMCEGISRIANGL